MQWTAPSQGPGASPKPGGGEGAPSDAGAEGTTPSARIWCRPQRASALHGGHTKLHKAAHSPHGRQGLAAGLHVCATQLYKRYT